MLILKVPEREFYDEVNSIFIKFPAQTLRLEHSLVSVSKWESKYHVSFLHKRDKNDAEMLDYIRFMTITQNVPDNVYDTLGQEEISQIANYIDDPMTATTFSDKNNRPSYEIITAEIIYYWMISFNIPAEYQKWHLNRLLTLIKVCAIKASKNSGKKMSKSEILRRNHALNQERKALYNTTG